MIVKYQSRTNLKWFIIQKHFPPQQHCWHIPIFSIVKMTGYVEGSVCPSDVISDGSDTFGCQMAATAKNYVLLYCEQAQ